MDVFYENTKVRMNKIILDLCGGTGSWSKPYREAGYDVQLITLPDQDVRYYKPPKNVYGVLAAPPCNKFSRAAWSIKKIDREFKKGMVAVRACMNIIWRLQENAAQLKFWALENPQGYLNRFLGHPAFYFQPWEFGTTSPLRTKRTYLWGYFNRPVKLKRKRDFPFINSRFKDIPGSNKSHRNKGFDCMNPIKRAITPAEFATAFFKANQ